MPVLTNEAKSIIVLDIVKQQAKINPRIFEQITALHQVVGKEEMRQIMRGEEGNRHMVTYGRERERQLRIG